LEPGQVEEKKRKEKPGVTRQDPVKTRLQSVDFYFFLLKQRRFDLKKNLTRVTRSKPETRVLDRAGSENYAITINNDDDYKN
jgi:hypothetical protein